MNFLRLCCVLALSGMLVAQSNLSSPLRFSQSSQPMGHGLKSGRNTAPPASNLNFAPAESYNSGGRAFTVAIADLNGDGKPDLVVAAYCTKTDVCDVG